MRGRTLSNSFIILDEAQNTTAMQMKMCLTRLGENSKMAVTGDITQIDLPSGMESGLKQALELFGDIEGIKFTYFNQTDVLKGMAWSRKYWKYMKRAGRINGKNCLSDNAPEVCSRPLLQIIKQRRCLPAFMF